MTTRTPIGSHCSATLINTVPTLIDADYGTPAITVPCIAGHIFTDTVALTHLNYKTVGKVSYVTTCQANGIWSKRHNCQRKSCQYGSQFILACRSDLDMGSMINESTIISINILIEFHVVFEAFEYVDGGHIQSCKFRKYYCEYYCKSLLVKQFLKK